MCPVTNAPLLVAPGSHRLGRMAEADVPAVVQRCGVAACTAVAGDVWLYVTPILHASKAATDPGHRRVLQVDYAASDRVASGGSASEELVRGRPVACLAFDALCV